MVEDHRDELVVVFAGYPSEMDELMAHSRCSKSVSTVILFEDYCVSELMQIAQVLIGKQHLNMTPEAEATLQKKLQSMVDLATQGDSRENGNGRAVRNIVEQAMRAQALRLSSDKSTMRQQSSPSWAEDLSKWHILERMIKKRKNSSLTKSRRGVPSFFLQ